MAAGGSSDPYVTFSIGDGSPRGNTKFLFRALLRLCKPAQHLDTTFGGLICILRKIPQMHDRATAAERKKVSTRVMVQSLEPEWNQRFELLVQHQEVLEGKELMVSVQPLLLEKTTIRKLLAKLLVKKHRNNWII